MSNIYYNIVSSCLQAVQKNKICPLWSKGHSPFRQNS